MTDISEKQKKKAEKLLNDLKTGQQKIPTTVAVTVIQTVEKEVVKRVDRIKNNVEIMRDSKSQIIEDLLFLKEHQDELTKKTGLTFEAFIKEVAGYSKQYFYQLTGNYEFLKSNDKTALLDTVDYKIINEIKKIDNPKLQKEYLSKAETLTRADIYEIKERVSPAYSENTVQNTFRPSDSENRTEPEKAAYVYPEKQPNKELDKFKIKVNKKIQYQIDMFESYIKQLRKKKKEKVQNDAQIMAYQIVISNLKELLKEL